MLNNNISNANSNCILNSDREHLYQACGVGKKKYSTRTPNTFSSKTPTWTKDLMVCVIKKIKKYIKI